MSTYLPANLPATVNTIEKLIVWALGVFYQLHKNTRYQESDAAPLIPRITCQDGLAANGEECVIFRVSIPLSATWRESTNKYFVEALEVSNAAIPSAFLP
jgi:hypothetical protein